MKRRGLPTGVRFLEWLTFQQRAGQFQELRGIAVTYPPIDAPTYRKYLPSIFGIPAHPLVMVVVIEYLRVSPWPFSRYLESAVLLKTALRGKEGWFPVIMPVTKWIARQGGHHLGFPKFVTPAITFTEDASGARGHATGFQGQPYEVDMRFTPDRLDAFAAAEHDDDEPLFTSPFHVLKPVGVGPESFTVRFEDVKPSCWRSWRGTVTLGGGFVGLIPVDGRTLPGTLHRYTGGMNLVYADLP